MVGLDWSLEHQVDCLTGLLYTSPFSQYSKESEPKEGDNNEWNVCVSYFRDPMN